MKLTILSSLSLLLKLTYAFPNGSPVCTIQAPQMITQMGGTGSLDLKFTWRLLKDGNGFASGVLIDSTAPIGPQRSSLNGILIWTVVDDSSVVKLESAKSAQLFKVPSAGCKSRGLFSWTHTNSQEKDLPLTFTFSSQSTEKVKLNGSVHAVLVSNQRDKWQILDPMPFEINSMTPMPPPPSMPTPPPTGNNGTLPGTGNNRDIIVNGQVEQLGIQISFILSVTLLGFMIISI